MLRITAPHFVAGLIMRDGKARMVAPIVRYMANWTESDIRRYVRHKNWRIETL